MRPDTPVTIECVPMDDFFVHQYNATHSVVVMSYAISHNYCVRS